MHTDGESSEDLEQENEPSTETEDDETPEIEVETVLPEQLDSVRAPSPDVSPQTRKRTIEFVDNASSSSSPAKKRSAKGKGKL